LSAYNGLSRRSPGLALILLVALLSLGGIPPFGGFVVKLLVFASAIQQPPWCGWLRRYPQLGHRPLLLPDCAEDGLPQPFRS